MKIGELAEALGDNLILASGDMEQNVFCVVNDNRAAAPGCLFVGVKGFVSDGHDFASDAAERGAAAIVSERPLDVLSDNVKASLLVHDSRKGLAAAAALFYGEPSKKLRLIGVTGTKGKTTVSYMLYGILKDAGMNPGLIGTIERIVNAESSKSSETTPESLELQGLLAKMVDSSAGAAVMEVSSQGLKLSRVEYCDFDIGVFTNLYEDHISPSEHKDIDDYMSAKLRLFSICKDAVVNADIPQFPLIRDTFLRHRKDGTLISYSTDESSAGYCFADVRAKNINSINDEGNVVSFDVETPWFKENVRIALPGRFNVSNALAAISCAGLLGVSKHSVKAGLSLGRVRGRTQLIDEGQDFTVIVDYAHNAVSLETLLTTIRESSLGRVITVFGCGGNRARNRRFDMGETSGRMADLTIVTSDNPRDEEPLSIMKDIETGIKKTSGQYEMVLDRRSAIMRAVSCAGRGDVVVVAGKGHESTQTFSKGRVTEFDDAQVARELLREMRL